MRTFTICFLAMGLLLQMGCASIPSMSKLTMRRKPKPDPKGSENYVKAKELERQGKFERARELYEQILEKDPDNSEYLRRLAVICTRLQRYGEADDFFHRAYKRAPKDANLLVDMGYSSYLRGDLVEAERWLRDSVHLKPSDKRAVTNLALVVGIRGNIDESRSLLLEIDDKPTALTNLAYIHTQRMEYDLAEQCFREALAIDGKHKDAEKGLAELAKLRPEQAIAVAESKSIDQETFKPFDVDFPSKTSPPIQQVSATADEGKRAVITADFTEEAADPGEPGLLDSNQKSQVRAATAKVTTAGFDDEGAFDQDPPSVTPQTPTRQVPASADEWDADPQVNPAASKSVKGTKATAKSLPDPFDDDSPADQPTNSIRPASPLSTTNAETLKFVPSRSRPKTPATDAADNPDQPFVIESRTVN